MRLTLSRKTTHTGSEVKVISKKFWKFVTRNYFMEKAVIMFGFFFMIMGFVLNTEGKLCEKRWFTIWVVMFSRPNAKLRRIPSGLENSILIQYLGDITPGMECFSTWKDVVIPAFVNNPKILAGVTIFETICTTTHDIIDRPRWCNHWPCFPTYFCIFSRKHKMEII